MGSKQKHLEEKKSGSKGKKGEREVVGKMSERKVAYVLIRSNIIILLHMTLYVTKKDKRWLCFKAHEEWGEEGGLLLSGWE